jgi:hypothetical protein
MVPAFLAFHDTDLLKPLCLSGTVHETWVTSGATTLYVVFMAAVVVGVDLLFFRNRFWERLMVNVGIVLVFAAFYLRFLRHP